MQACHFGVSPKFRFSVRWTVIVLNLPGRGRGDLSKQKPGNQTSQFQSGQATEHMYLALGWPGLSWPGLDKTSHPIKHLTKQGFTCLVGKKQPDTTEVLEKSTKALFSCLHKFFEMESFHI